jgi:exo-beta-1,3-glucanase (GH17 family)
MSGKPLFRQVSVFHIAALLMALMLACAGVVAQSKTGGRELRIAAAVGAVRFVAYTPTDLNIVSGQVSAASKQAVRADLEILRHDFDGLVTYSCVDGVEQVPGIASELGYRALVLGVWDPLSARETANAVRLARAFPQLVVGVAVGNETLLAQRHEWATLRAAMQRLRAALPEVAIATSEPFYFYLNQDPPDFLAEQDFLLPSIHPLYEPWFAQASDQQAVDFVVQVVERLSALSDKPLLVKETGLPSGPPERGFTPARQAGFWLALTQRLPAIPGRAVAYFEAFDHPWKVENAAQEFSFRPEEAFWGLYSRDAEAKPALTGLRRVWSAHTGTE